MKNASQREAVLGMTDSELAKAAKLYQQQGKAKNREAAELYSRADFLRKELRRRKAAPRAENQKTDGDNR